MRLTGDMQYWLGYLEDALRTLEGLPGNVAKVLSADDWKLLVAEAPLGASRQAREELFFPAQSNGAGRRRRKGFLERVSDSDYKDIFEHVLSDLSLEFPDIASLLKTSKSEGKIIAQVVEHVVDWLNDKPAVIVNRQHNNKPQLREDYVPALIRHGQRRGTPETYHQEAAAEDCRVLERSIIESVRYNMSFFANDEGKARLQRRLREDQDQDAYGVRFEYEEWAAILTAVEEVFDHEPPLPWKASSTIERSNEKESSLRKMEQSIQQAILANPRIARNEMAQRRRYSRSLQI